MNTLTLYPWQHKTYHSIGGKLLPCSLQIHCAAESLSYTSTLSTTFGVCVDGVMELDNGVKTKLTAGMFFSSINRFTLRSVRMGRAVLMQRIGYAGEPYLGGPIDDEYPSVLIPRLYRSAPALEMMVLPAYHDDGSMHAYASDRIGVVIDGACECVHIKNNMRVSTALGAGSIFHLAAKGVHRLVGNENGKVCRLIVFNASSDFEVVNHEAYDPIDTIQAAREPRAT